MFNKIKKWFKEQNWLFIVLMILMVILIVSILLTAIFYIWAFMTYKDTPISELPWWVLWMLH